MIYFRFVDDGSWIAEGIDFTTNSIWPHVEFGDRQRRTWIGAHHGGGVEERGFYYCKVKRQAIYAVDWDDRILDDARADVGKTAYDMVDIAGLFLHIRGLDDGRNRICSQWCFLKAWNRGVTMLNALPEFSHLITPEGLHLSPLFIGRKIDADLY